MLALYHTLISEPLLNILIFLYNTVALQDLGIAIIALTLLIRIALYPLFQKGLRYQTAMQQLQPKLKQLQVEHKGDYEKQSKAMMQLYKDHNISPFSGIIIILVQIPILFALYYLFLNIFKPETLNAVYSFIDKPEILNTNFFGLFDLHLSFMPLVVLTGILQFLQTYMMIKFMERQGADKTQLATTRMLGYVMPVVTIFIFLNLPSAITLYWFTTSLISIGQQYMINRQRSAIAQANAAK